MRRRIFIGSSTEALEIAYSLQENLERNFECTVWTQESFSPSEYTLESLEDTLESCDYGIFVFSPDDKIVTRDKESYAARDNIIFEFGLFIGRLGRENTFLVMPQYGVPIKLPSDLIGITSLKYNDKRTDNNITAALGPACNKITRLIQSQEDTLLQVARNQYDILNNKFPSRRSIRYLDTACVFGTRTAFDNCIGVQRVFSNAKDIKALGISLNEITINWGIRNLVQVIKESRCTIKLLLLDPECEATKMREKEEDLFEDTIRNVTNTNVNLLRTVKKQIQDFPDALSYRFYNKAPFINMYIVNGQIIILQNYIYGTRGQESPVYIIRDEGHESGLFQTYNSIFDRMWDESYEDIRG